MSTQFIERPAFQPTVRLVDKRTVGRETKRWLYWGLDVIPPLRKSQLKGWYLHGGEEVGTICLQKHGIGFIPRGLPALLETAPDFMPEEQLRNVGGGIQQGLIVDDASQASGILEIQSRIPYVLAYPGDARTSVLVKADNHPCGKKGIIELASLIGKEWDECHNEDRTGVLDIVEQAFFGDGIEPTLRGLEEQIKHGKVSELLSIDVGRLKDEQLESCSFARGWGLAVLSLEHANLKQGTHPAGHVFEYSPLGRLMLSQLEVQPQDQPFAELAKMTGSIAQSVESAMNRPHPDQGNGGMSMGDAIELGRRLALAEARVAELEAAAAVKPEPVMLACDCGKEFPTPQGLSLHKTRHCELNKNEG